MQQDELEDLLTKAVEVYRSVPSFSELYMSRTDAMVAVGIPRVKANTERLQQQIHRMTQGYNQRYGPAMHTEGYESNLSRTRYLGERITVNPSGEKLTQVYKMKLAGFCAADTKAGKAFMKVSRDLKKLEKTAMEKDSLPSCPQLPPVVPVSPSLSSQSTQSTASFASKLSKNRPPTISVPPAHLARSDDVISPLSLVSNLTPAQVIYNAPPAYYDRWDDYNVDEYPSCDDDDFDALALTDKAVSDVDLEEAVDLDLEAVNLDAPGSDSETSESPAPSNDDPDSSFESYSGGGMTQETNLIRRSNRHC